MCMPSPQHEYIDTLATQQTAQLLLMLKCATVQVLLFSATLQMTRADPMFPVLPLLCALLRYGVCLQVGTHAEYMGCRT